MPVLALPRELGRPGPVAAQPDLRVTRAVDRARLDETEHRRAVRALDAEHLAAGVGVRVEVDQPDRPARSAIAAMHGSVIEWSPPSVTGSAPASTTSPTSRSIAACVAAGSAGMTGASP